MRQFTVDDIFAFEARAAVLDFQALLRRRREKGFMHFIPDLAKGTPDAQGHGWTFKKGMLNVKPNHNTDEIMDFLERNLGQYKWFQTRAQRAEMIAQGVIIEEPQLPQGYDTYTELFKTLGSWGKNLAMDVVTLLRNADGTISVQLIERPRGEGYAFVGGMIGKDDEKDRQKVLDQCYMETLEEFYSNDLFAKYSATLRQGTKVNNTDQTRLSTKLNDIFDLAEFGDLANFKDQLIQSMPPSANLESKLQKLQDALRALNGQPLLRKGQAVLINGQPAKHTVEALEHFWVRIKCQLYKELCPEQYEDFVNFLRDHLVDLPETTNETDYRNTQLAYMATIPHYFLIDREELKQKEAFWGVRPKGGDDAVSAKIIPLHELYEHLTDPSDPNRTKMFSAHLRILTQCIGTVVEQDPSMLENPYFQEQLGQIAKNLEEREFKELGITPAVTASGSAIVLQTAANGMQQLPIISREPQLTQLQNAIMSVSEGIISSVEAVSSINEAIELLKVELGAIRYARLCDQLENLHLPMSFLPVLAELCLYDSVECVLDNSGSMSQGMTTQIEVKLPNGQVQLTSQALTRWQDAHRRLSALTVLLGMAGVKFNIRFLNEQRGVSQTRSPATEVFTFNYVLRKDRNGNILPNDITLLENELKSSEMWLSRLFQLEPGGGTSVASPLREALRKHDGKKRGILIVTDGEATDLAETQEVVKTRRDPHLTPISVVACTNASEQIQWVRTLQTNDSYYIAMLDDYKTQRDRMHNAHSTRVPYPPQYWLALHVTFPQNPATPISDTGFFVYLKADKLTAELTQEQLSEMVGYAVPDEMYQDYVTFRQAQQTQTRGILSAQPTMFGATQHASSRSQVQPPTQSSSTTLGAWNPRS